MVPSLANFGSGTSCGLLLNNCVIAVDFYLIIYLMGRMIDEDEDHFYYWSHAWGDGSPQEGATLQKLEKLRCVNCHKRVRGLAFPGTPGPVCNTDCRDAAMKTLQAEWNTRKTYRAKDEQL